MKKDPVTVIIVDDHDLVRKGARGYLEVQPDIDVVAEAESGKEAILLVKEHAPDVVIMDLIMPEMDGVETTRKIKQISPRSQIIILTSYHQDEHIFPALQAGATSYLLKDVKASELVDAIHRAAQGEASLHPRVAARVINQFNSTDSRKCNLFTDLTDRELDVLTLIARGLSNQQISEELVISVGTVKGHVSNILSKLHLTGRTQAAVYAWQEGIIRRN
ncbi:MAG: response regulator transcription factor [Anaerolineaceae bacterium]|nr:response regulator transcription factor [Anaerolineaceae bacterium]